MQDIRITHTVILHDPFDDPAGFQPRADSPMPTKETGEIFHFCTIMFIFYSFGIGTVIGIYT
jgi:hypothetical protein